MPVGVNMCGVVGLVGCQGSQAEREMLTRRMAARLEHRGPDDHGVYADADVQLGFRRLSILDLSANGHQPMTNEDGRLWLVANGEIYNHRALRSELEGRGHVFRSQSDCEVILHAYEQWGTRCLERLDGMFAWLLWDRQARRLIVARDRLGIKPLYYVRAAGGLAFASEAKALFALDGQGWRPSLDETQLETWLHFPFLTDPERTMVQGIRKVPPATYAVWEDGELTWHRYWSLDAVAGRPAAASFDEAVHRLRALLVDTVRTHLMADVPVAVLLSGGVDSSALLGALRQADPGRRVRTFTIGFDDPRDERPYARHVAEALRTDHQELILDTMEIVRRFDDGIRALDDLSTADGGFWSLAMASKLIREQGIKVVLVGEGADELFGGYHLFKLSQRPFRWLPPVAQAGGYYWLTTGVRNRDLFRYGRLYRPAFGAHADAFAGIAAFEMTRQLPNNLLLKVDKATMAHGVEARVPYLDHHMVEFVHSLPGGYKLAGAWYTRGHEGVKRLLREAARPWLPPDIVGRKKQGFLLPLLWRVPAFLELLRGTLEDRRGLAWQRLGREGVTRLLADPFRHRFAAWRWLVLSRWSDEYLTDRTGETQAEPVPALPAEARA